MTKVIALRPYHIVTEIRGVKKEGSSFHKFSKKIFYWRFFYKKKLKRFIGMTIYVKTLNWITGESFYNSFYVDKDSDGNLRLW